MVFTNVSGVMEMYISLYTVYKKERGREKGGYNRVCTKLFVQIFRKIIILADGATSYVQCSSNYSSGKKEDFFFIKIRKLTFFLQL